MDGFAFAGGTITARKLRQQVTAYSEGALQTALEHGCQSVPEVMDFLTRRDNERARLHVLYSRKGKVAGDIAYKRIAGVV